jgi:hypothetical protein|tara:strand:+ start:588 stop:815 length:228 start_codon:yes stop_codon:yes gene_type:complete
MEEILILVESYGLPLVLLLGALYALYRFFVFSLYEVKNEFGKRHEDNAKAMSELKIAVAELKEKINTVLDFVKRK